MVTTAPKTSEAVARRLGVGYDTLMRWVRAGFIDPPGYTGQHRVPVQWSEVEIARARLVKSLFQTGLSKKEVAYTLTHHAKCYAAGFKPFWIVDRVNSKGDVSGRALALMPPALGPPPSREISGTTGEGVQITLAGELLHVPLGDGGKQQRRKATHRGDKPRRRK